MGRLLVAGLVLAVLVAASGFVQADDRMAIARSLGEADTDLQGPFPYDEFEPQVAASPEAPLSVQLPAGVTVRDFEVSPAGGEVALVVEDGAHRQRLAFWQFRGNALDPAIDIPADMRITALAWHPQGRSLFLLGADGRRSVILRQDRANANFAPETVFASDRPIRRLVVGPRPFLIAGNRTPGYRLFFGEAVRDGTFALRSVSVGGQAAYTVVGPKPDAAFRGLDPEETPNTTIAASALPVAFHPAGNVLIWEDDRKCLHKTSYATNNWGGTANFGQACGAIVAYTPNGAATLEWRPGVPGLRVHGLIDKSDRTVLTDFILGSVPAQTPDGRGVVAVTTERSGESLRYLPIDVKLANVINAWMYLADAGDQKRFAEDRGLFRRQPESEQLYQLYDSESYTCGNPDARIPTRPYYVTTDLFWELYGAAFDGLFIILEREQAMPAFAQFVAAADDDLRAHHAGSTLAKAFAAARAVLDGKPDADPEAGLIVAAKGTALSGVLATPLDYGQFRPRGHYKSVTQQRYFGAMRYLSLLRLNDGDVALLRSLDPAVSKAAEAWITTYRPFIAASRLDVVWGGGIGKTAIASHPDPAPAGWRLFPLAWGWDNEALDNVIYHQFWPPAEQIVDRAGGGRVLPSGLDFAAIAGDRLAEALLQADANLAGFANLPSRREATRRRFAAAVTHPPATLYEAWIDGLAMQWADAASAPLVAGPLWDAKRLQTGLASWATLRHATVLVNDQTAAECGEGGFEDIVLRPPRGYVEPDPASFRAIAGLFDATIAVVRSSRFAAKDDAVAAQLRDGIIRRLAQSRDSTIRYQAIAEKERGGIPLTAQDYDAIQYVGRAAEHNFLVFMSLSNPDYALSIPDPMMKIADVAGAGGQFGVLETAVGRPLEWDQIVPFYGRAEIVKGSIYSYDEFAAAESLDDAQWRRLVDARKPQDWVARFLSNARLLCPAAQP